MNYFETFGFTCKKIFTFMKPIFLITPCFAASALLGHHLFWKCMGIENPVFFFVQGLITGILIGVLFLL